MIYTITLCFNRPDVIRRSLLQYLATRNEALEYTHVLVDNCYPLPNKQQNSAALKEFADKHGMLLLSPGKNLGLHGGWNWACKQLPLTDQDIIIGYDPDSYPLSPGWDMALVSAIACDESHGWASLMSPRASLELSTRAVKEKMVDGHIRLWQIAAPVVNSICAWRWSFLRRAGGLKEPTNFYGHLETSMWTELKNQKLEWVFVRDWHEDDTLRHDTDRSYIVYKWVHAHLRAWDGDFESWLEAGQPNPEDKAPSKLP